MRRYEKATKCGLLLDAAINRAGLAVKQGVDVDCESYFRISLITSLVDFLICELVHRLQSHRSIIFSLQALIPTFSDKFSWKDLEPHISCMLIRFVRVFLKR